MASTDRDPDTASRILDVAERLVQTRGFNAFSYADVASELNVTKAALHYHFASKAELGEALIDRYGTRFAEALAAVDTQIAEPGRKLGAYADLYLEVLRGHRMCLCGMLAAEHETLPAAMRARVIRFLDDNEAWVARVLKQGRKDGTLSFNGAPNDVARMIVSGLEGAMLMARPYSDATRFQAAARALLASLTAGAGNKSAG